MAESFHVNLEEYQGPFDVLLSLVSQRQLELTQISLSAVTEEFVAYIKQLDMRDNADQVSSFIDVASILIEAKSAQLIPREQADEDFEAHLEALQQRDLLFARLLQYRAFKTAGEEFRRSFAAHSGRFAHPGTLSQALAQLIPEVEMTLSLDDLARLAARELCSSNRHNLLMICMFVGLTRWIRPKQWMWWRFLKEILHEYRYLYRTSYRQRRTLRTA